MGIFHREKGKEGANERGPSFSFLYFLFPLQLVTSRGPLRKKTRYSTERKTFGIGLPRSRPFLAAFINLGENNANIGFCEGVKGMIKTPPGGNGLLPMTERATPA